jgi:hypothetical protein
MEFKTRSHLIGSFLSPQITILSSALVKARAQIEIGTVSDENIERRHFREEMFTDHARIRVHSLCVSWVLYSVCLDKVHERIGVKQGAILLMKKII